MCSRSYLVNKRHVGLRYVTEILVVAGNVCLLCLRYCSSHDSIEFFP